MAPETSAAGEARVGFCSILGLPNVGKSTLLNRLLGVRLAAVSTKPQTTRNRILGVHNRPDDDPPAQIVFVDTPGIQRGKGALRQYMRDQALAAAGDCDVALLLVDVSDPHQRSPDRLREVDAAALTEALAALAAPVILGLNKIDRIADKRALLEIIAAYADAGDYEEVVPISARKGDGVDDGRLAGAIAARLPLGQRLFPEDMITDRAERFLAGELIREQLFRQLGQELPYATAVVVETLRERPRSDDVALDAVIYVERESQKGIVIGKSGARIKEVGSKARAAISQLFKCEVHLNLRVKVAENWSRGARGIRDMGYE